MDKRARLRKVRNLYGDVSSRSAGHKCESRAHYPGRSAPHRGRGDVAETARNGVQKSAEGIVLWQHTGRPESRRKQRFLTSMKTQRAGNRSEMAESTREERARNAQGNGMDASVFTADRR